MDIEKLELGQNLINKIGKSKNRIESLEFYLNNYKENWYEIWAAGNLVICKIKGDDLKTVINKELIIEKAELLKLEKKFKEL